MQYKKIVGLYAFLFLFANVLGIIGWVEHNINALIISSIINGLGSLVRVHAWDKME